jgi:hypothetical protein
MKSSELEDSSKLATREWVEDKLADLKVDLKTDRLERQSKLMNCAGLIGFGLIWGFLLAEIFFLRK